MLLCLDIGGTSIKLGFVDEAGTIFHQQEVSVCFDNYCTSILQTALSASESMLASADFHVEGISISATGQVDTKTGTVIGTNGKIPGYEGSNFKSAFEKHFHLPTCVLNDANAAVLGECFVGRAKGLRDVIMLTIGTGVGGGIVLGCKLYGGMRGIAGELGHFTLYQDGQKCPCGKRGCLENYASTTALIRLAESATGEKGLNGRDIFHRAQDGDQLICSVLEKWIGDIAAGITGLVHIFNPEMVLIGGGVSRQDKLLMNPLRNQVLNGVMPRFAEGLQVEAAALGNDAGMIGAAKFFRDEHVS